MLPSHSDHQHVDSIPPAPSPADSLRSRGRGAAGGLLVVLGLCPVAFLGQTLWKEWSFLRLEEAAADSSAVVGYPNIYPNISRAQPPEPWRRAEGDRLFIWGGWKSGEGHRWFELDSRDCALTDLGAPIGRDVAQAIDHPAVEAPGGALWSRIPSEAGVAGVSLGKTDCAYPMAVLDKVLVVNDYVDGAPYLVYNDPVRSEADGAEVAVYEAALDGRRITMGNGGFSIAGRHVLYDRGTESLWVDQGSCLESVSGKHKGKRLPLVTRASETPWRDWRDDHPQSRLLVGSLERTRGIPAE